MSQSGMPANDDAGGPSPTTWREFKTAVPELGGYADRRLARSPSFLATVRSDGRPRVHPVTIVLDENALFLFTEPTSPKSHDLRDRRWFALHNRIDDDQATGGEVLITGEGWMVDDPAARASAVAAATYEPEDRYVLFELRLVEVIATTYGADSAPSPRRWRAN